MNEKSVSISVYVENKTIRISHWRMLSHLCRVRVLWFHLKLSLTDTLVLIFKSTKGKWEREDVKLHSKIPMAIQYPITQ